MDSGRVRGILQAVEAHQEVALTREERDAVVGQGLLGTVPAGTHDAWAMAVSGLPALRDRVREASRVALATPGPEAPPELRQMIGDLEELTRQKASLDALVWNGPTQEYVLPTLPGRTTLQDLSTWQARLGGRSFEDFLAQMVAYRQDLVATVNRANAIYRGLKIDEESRYDEVDTGAPFTTVDLRFAAMILAKRPVDPYLLVRAFQFLNHDTAWGTLNPEDRLIGSAILASLPLDVGTARQNFEYLRIQLANHGVLPEDRIIVAASLADLDPGWWEQVFSRIDAIRQVRGNLNALLVSALARSPYSVDEALGRFDDAILGMAAKGFKDGIAIDAAASILASAQIPREAMADRFAFTASNLAGAFDPPYAPAAMLAASPLEPVESVDVFRDCIGTITRTNFFDLTLEIEELALVMSYGVAPLGMGYLAANLPPGAAVVPPVPTAAMPVYFGPSWYVWHNYWVYRPLGRYIATHPVHVHTVAAFG